MSPGPAAEPMRDAFHAALRFHEPILAPIRAVVAGGAETLLTGNRRAAVEFAPHVVVLAASTHLEYFRRHAPGAFLVNVRQA